MADLTVAKLAELIGLTSEKLLEQFASAGVKVDNAAATISDEQKKLLLGHLQSGKSKASAPLSTKKKLSLNKTSEAKPTLAHTSLAKPKTLSVAVRKKKVFTKPPVAPHPGVQVVASKPEDVLPVKKAPAKPIKPAAPKEIKKEQKTPPKPVIKHKPASSSGRSAVKVTQKAAITKKVHAFEKPVAPMVYEVSIPETITVADLAKKMSIKGIEVIKVLMNMGSMATINQVLDQDTAVLIVEELGHTPKAVSDDGLEQATLWQETEHTAVKRPPVVTIMGHVDHGKTSLLDYIRSTKVASGESGGITQHIGAYHVKTPKGVITFLDTPGHAAFTAMRARGAKVTDIVVIVVAADDGVKPQTIEAIQHAKSADIPIVVAINKIDKPEADVDKVTGELSQHGIMPESWGGDNIFVNLSAKEGTNIDELLESLLLVAEVQELNAPVAGNARGIVIESKLDKGRGPISSVLVTSGTLKVGDIIIAGLQFGKIKGLFDESNHALTSAGPSIPVEVLGLSGVCAAGDEVAVIDDERKAKELSQHRQAKSRDIQLTKQRKVSLDNIFAQHQQHEKSTLNIVLKADVNGSAEAIRDALLALSNDEVKVNIVAYGVGGINESDVNLAAASKAIILGFNVRASATAKKIIDFEKIDLHYYSVIYDLINQVKQALSGLLAPEYKEEIIGIANVREVFKSPKIGAIAGCMVIDGNIKRNNPIRVLRDDVVIFEGSLESLRRFKDDVNEVRQGTECGIGVKNYNDVKVGDQIEVFEKVEVKRVLD